MKRNYLTGFLMFCKVVVCVLSVLFLVSQHERYSSYASDGEVKIRKVHIGDFVHGYITENGDLYVRGENKYGVLGINSQNENFVVSSPIKIMENVKQFDQSLGYVATAVCINGDVYAWGKDIIVSGENQLYPVMIAENAKKAYSYGDGRVMILLENGDLVKYSQGTSKTIANNVGDYFPNAYVTEEGELYKWGSYDRYIKVMDNVMKFDMGGQTGAVITYNGDLYMWGSNSFGQVGNGSTEDVLQPTKIMGGVRNVCVGEEHVVALNQKNELYSWGNNKLGQMGIGDNKGDNECVEYPTKIMENVAKVTLQKSTIETVNSEGAAVSVSGASYAITLDGRLYSWGCNRECVLGIGKTFNEQEICLEPTYVASNVAEIDVNVYEGIYIDKEGRIYQIGRDFYAGKYTQNSTPVKMVVRNSGIEDVFGNAGSDFTSTNTNSSIIYVHDLDSNKRISGAIVEVLDANGTVLESIEADKDGIAIIQDRVGMYDLRIRADKYLESYNADIRLGNICSAYGLRYISDKPMVVKALVNDRDVLKDSVKVLNNADTQDILIYAYFRYNNAKGDTIARVELLQGDKVLRARNAVDGVDLSSSYTLFQISPSELVEDKKIYIRAISSNGLVGAKTETKINVMEAPGELVSIDDGFKVEFDFPQTTPFFDKCKFSIDMTEIPISIEVGDDGSIRAGINIVSHDKDGFFSSDDTAWKEIKKAVKEKKSYSEFIKKKEQYYSLIKEKGVLGAAFENKKIDFEIWGYGEANPKSGVIKCEAIVTVKFKMGAEIPIELVIPLVFTVDVTAELEGQISLQYNTNEYEGMVCSGGLKMTIGLELGIGPGVPKTASLTVRANGKLIVDKQWGAEEYLDIDLKVQGKIVFKFLFISTSIETKPITVDLYDDRKKNMLELSQEDSITLYAMDDLTNIDNFEVMSREYLSNQSSWNPLVRTRSIGSNKVLLQSSIYDDPNLHYVESNGTKMIVFLTDSEERNAANRTLLVYSIYDEENATWGTPIAIDDTGMADFTPNVYGNENGIYITWSSAKTEINDMDAVTDAVSNLEIKYAVWDEEEQRFTVETITDDECYQTLPCILEADNDVFVAWIENTDNNIFCLDGTNKVKLYSVNSQSVIFEQEITTPLELVLGCENGKVLLATICDNDFDYLTLDDHQLLIWDTDGTTLVDKTGNISALKNHENTLYWLENGVLTCNEGLYFGFENKITDYYQIVEAGTNKYILFSEMDGTSLEAKTSIWAYIYDAEKNSWENKIVISDTDESIQEFISFFNGNGDIASVLVSCSTLDDEYGTQVASMYSDIYVHSCDLELSEVSYSDVVLGEDGVYSLDVDALLTNRGGSTENDITFSLVKNGEIVATSTQSKTVATGSSEEISVTFNIGETLELGIYTVDVAIDEIERELDNNSYEIYLGRPDIAVDYSMVGSYDNYVLAVSVSNMGHDAAECVFDLRKDSLTGESIFTKELGNIGAGEVKSFLIELDADVLSENNEDLFLYLCVDSDNENETSLGNNDTYCLIKPAEESTAVLEISDQYIQLEVGEEATLTAILSSFTEVEESDIEWESLDELVAYVDMSGRVKATGVGTTQIRAKANNLEVSCTVEVIGEHTDLKFDKVNLTLYSDLSINFKVLKSLFTEGQYSNPYAQFVFGNETINVATYREEGDYYVFTYSNIAPDKMNDTIQATLYATYGNGVVQGASISYGIGEYCYRVLEVYAEGDAYEEIRRMFVDLLNYGAASQIYTGYKTEQLVNSMLTETQKAYGTSTNPTLQSITDKSYVENEDATITWKSASLYLYNTIAIRVKFSAESIENVKVKIECAGKEYWYDEADFVYDESNDAYMVEFDRLNPAQLREACYFTVYSKDGIALSNTLRFSAESYAYAVQGYQNSLSDMIIAMMKYGDSAYSYIN